MTVTLLIAGIFMKKAIYVLHSLSTLTSKRSGQLLQRVQSHWRRSREALRKSSQPGGGKKETAQTEIQKVKGSLIL